MSTTYYCYVKNIFRGAIGYRREQDKILLLKVIWKRVNTLLGSLIRRAINAS